MRIIAAFVIWVVLIGGLLLYMQEPEAVLQGTEYHTEQAVGHFVLTVTPSFGAEPDPFALDLDDAANTTTLRVRLNGEDVLSRTDTLVPGIAIVLDPAPGLIVGENEFYLEASPSLDATQQAHALRVQVLQDGIALAEKTLWSEPGGRIADTMALDLSHAVTEVKEEDDAH